MKKGVAAITIIWGPRQLGWRPYAADREAQFKTLNTLSNLLVKRFSAGRVGGEALGDRGGESRLVDEGEVAGLVTF